MFDDTQELAESKLLILYLFKKINLPISNAIVTDIVLENNLLNYFQLQQYLSELVSSDFLYISKESKRQFYNITDKGLKTLSLFENRITANKKSVVDNYLNTHGELLKKRIQVTADYLPESDGSYLVTCKLSEDNITLIQLNLAISSNEKAKIICSRWKSNPYMMYKQIISLLTD